jgi:GH43 family beta-xylosidase
MHGRKDLAGRGTYVNPVYPNSFPDPFVLKHKGKYYGYCTGDAAGGLIFGIIGSDDLVNWQDIGGAMSPIADAPPFYWAPEVVYDNGKFYLYYSAGNETLMHLRVAVSDRPDGGFVDSGRVLTSEEFAIDAHVFTDDDGERYMFYATDFLEHTHIGTGTVVDRMVDWFELAGDPRPVTRARHDWQVYDPQRKEKGGVRWHTVEGPTVIKRKRRYFEMFSGGNWQNTTYGVSFAVTDDIRSPAEWDQHADGETELPILRTLPGLVAGPGHNSVVRGPNNRELYCVYHCWTDAGRVMAIDRMDITGNEMFIVGPTYTPQLLPYSASMDDLHAGSEGDDANIRSNGEWRKTESGIEGSLTGRCERTYATGTDFLCEFTICCGSWKSERSKFGFRLAGPANTIFELSIYPATRTGSISNGEGDPVKEFYLPLDMVLAADHLVRVECSGGKVRTTIDGPKLVFDSPIDRQVSSFSIFADKAEAEFSALSITEGFEERFDSPALEIQKLGWMAGGMHDTPPHPESGDLQLTSNSECSITHNSMFEDAEFVLNSRLAAAHAGDHEYGIQLVDGSGSIAAEYSIRSGGLFFWVPGAEAEIELLELGTRDKDQYHQLRIVRTGGTLTPAFDEHIFSPVRADAAAVRLSVFCRRCTVALDMVRVTKL